MNKLSSEKYNILLIILVFVIPLFALDSSFIIISNIHFSIEKNEQKNIAIQEAESLALEGQFSNELAIHFRDFFEELVKRANLQNLKETSLVEHLKKSDKRIFESPFPNYNLYVFKIPTETKQTKMVYYNGNISSGKSALCKAFEHIYNLSNGKNDKTSEKFAKKLLGDHTEIISIANELKGIPTQINGFLDYSWFIWDSINIENIGVYGVILISNQINDYEKYGRLLALKRLKSRGQAIGAFIPLFKEYGEPVYNSPLDKSYIFLEWSKKFTAKNENDLNNLIKNSLPQGDELGRYSAFCHWRRGDTHVAVILVKSLKNVIFPNWLLGINIVFISLLTIILYVGLVFGIWPQLSLRLRFTISYALASLVPLCLLFIASYGYLIEYENTYIDKVSNQLQNTLKEFDSNKSTLVKDYKTTFNKAVNDKELIRLIEENGIKSELVTNHIVDYFEKSKPDNPLPIIGVRIYNEAGEGVFSKGSASTYYDFSVQFNSFSSAIVELLRDEMIKENQVLTKDYEQTPESQFANNIYRLLADRELKYDISTHFGIPISRKNGDFCSYMIFDIIKIDGKTKYIVQLMWDDKTLDEKIIKSTIYENALKRKEQNFIAYRINGQKIETIGEDTWHGSSKFKDKTIRLAKQSNYFKKTNMVVDNEDIMVIMPSLNFKQTIFVGSVNKIDIISKVFERKMVFAFFLIISIFIIWICSLRSAAVFLNPITELKQALEQVSVGNLNIAFKNDSDNELGTLTDEFDKMIVELREKERLSKLISDQAVQALEKNSSQALFGTETFNGVALVSDIRNFTGMSEENDPTVITELLNEHFAEMSKIISEKGGMIYKFIGDAIEAVFPEKAEQEKSASERAFEAGCNMISRLKVINSRRRKIHLFPYKIGVGLCYGTMYSGSVGSIETRLDYSIIGDPLKNAAKCEALSINNPYFPIVIDKDIADKISQHGFVFKEIKNEKVNNVFIFDGIYDSKALENNDISSETNLSENNDNDKTKIYSVSEESSNYLRYKDYLFNFFLIFLLSLLISKGLDYISFTTFDSLNNENQKEATRLNEQLKCDNVIKSAFDAVCFDFYDDIRNVLKDNSKPLSLKERIKQIDEKYKKLGFEIPLYCCFFYENKRLKNDDTVIKGFSDSVSNKIINFARLSYSIDRSIKERALQKFMGPSANLFYFENSYFRRSSIASIDDKRVLLNSEKIMDKNNNDLIAFIICALPISIDKELLPSYYRIISGKNLFMALKNNNNIYFSPNFPEIEKNKFKNNNDAYFKDKAYFVDYLLIDNEPYTVYTISKELYDYEKTRFNPYIVFIFTFCFIISIYIFINKQKLFAFNSIAARLRKDIFTSAIIPLLTVIIVFSLYVKEEINVNKAELKQNLNSLINEIESKSFYYVPYCENLLRKLFYNKEVQNNLSKVSNNKDINKKIRDELNDYLKSKVVAKNYKKSKSFDYLPNFGIKEVYIIGNNDFVASAEENEREFSKEKIDVESSSIGEIITKIVKSIYISKGKEDKHNKIEEAYKQEEVSKFFFKNITTTYGSDFTHRLNSFPNNLTLIINSYSMIAVYVGTYPDAINPEFILVGFIFFNNELLPTICNLKNNVRIPYHKHLEFKSKDDELYSFYSQDNNVGEFFFRGNRKHEDLDTVKELGLASSWLNTSYLPISRKVNLNGINYLEARQGNEIGDNVFAALGSEYPIIKKAEKRVKSFVIVILFSVLLIISISQSVILDLLDPVKKLIEGAMAASKGDYKFRLNFIRKDELGALCQSFDKMMKGLEDKQLMNRMVSKSALKGASYLSDNISKKVEVALIYITVPDFDKIMKNTNALDLFIKLRRQIALISEIVINNGGDIDKIMGEKLLVAFHSSDNADENLAINALKAASQIASNSELPFNVSIGVNYGEVISGYLGVGGKRDFTIIGDPVNVAARIAVYAEKLENNNRLIVSSKIMEMVKNKIKTEEYGEVLFKGKSKPAKVYRIIN